MKTLIMRDITEVAAEDVKPGMIVAEGVIIDSRYETPFFHFDTAGGNVCIAERGKRVPVLAKLSRESLEVLREAVRNAQA